MKKFYTDPLAAAYMHREFDVDYALSDPFNTEVMNYASLEDRIKRDCCKPVYIHPDSYHIFEPQVGDMVIASDSTWCAITVCDHGYADMAKRKEYKIIQRNNKPFFWPEQEGLKI